MGFTFALSFVIVFSCIEIILVCRLGSSIRETQSTISNKAIYGDDGFVQFMVFIFEGCLFH
jgi:hypothetical protein